MKKKRIVSWLLACAMVLGMVPLSGVTTTVQAAEAEAAALTVDLDPAVNTGEIIHGAAGFLYGVSSEDVPTTNTIVPLKSKILVTKGAVGTEHPYGDALDVAKTFLESGGEQVQMYISNYYGVIGPTATIEEYCYDLEHYICPAIVAWKDAWKVEHSDPSDPLSKIDIDEALVYVPINESGPVHDEEEVNTDADWMRRFKLGWQAYYETIKENDPGAKIAGTNDAVYLGSEKYGEMFQHMADNNCMPDVITWHELQTWCLINMQDHMDDFRDMWYNQIDWTLYNQANGIAGDAAPEIPQICINEYAEMEFCGVPGRLVNWMARLEDEKITGCLPFWHQANNLNDLASGANEGNGAWWLYQWYGNMSGTTQPVTSSTAYDQLYGLSTMDEAKKLSTTIFGGYTGDIVVELNNVDDTTTFSGAEWVNVTVEETMFSGFHGTANTTPTIVQGIYPVSADGTVEVTIPDAQFESAYRLSVTQVDESQLDAAGMVLYGSSGTVYEAENGAVSGTAVASAAPSGPSYYMSKTDDTLRAVDMPTGGVLEYTIDIPADGRYKLEFSYGNGQGSVRNDMNLHNPVNATQTFQLDDGDPMAVTMESTLFQTMTGFQTMYYDLTAGTHTITITTTSDVDAAMLFHDFLRVSYAAAYGEEVVYNRVYEAEMADFSKLLGNTDSTVTTETTLSGFSGNGYVQGLNERAVTAGGGIRYTVVVEESGLYNLTLRYQSSAAGSANIYVGNTAMTLDRVNKTVALAAGEGWQTVTASIYLQKGINVVDLDATVDAAVDYLRVRELDEQTHSTTIEAETATLSDGVTVAESAGASGGAYVESMAGSYDPDNREYLEFSYYAEEAGTYQMQVFHSNEDLAGSHAYNIKAIDKYATVEVNDYTDSPEFKLYTNNEEQTLYYFVDCGDPDPSTVNAGDSLGTLNSVTDQHYGADAATGYSWGLVSIDAEKDTILDSGYVETNHQRINSSTYGNKEDGQLKTATFRYADGQDTAGITPRKIAYRFELEPGQYDVTICMSNTWGNAGNPTIVLSDGTNDLVEQPYTVSGNTVDTMTVDLTDTDGDGKVDLTVMATSADATIQMNYILIQSPKPELPENVTELPGGVLAYTDEASLPENVYVGLLDEEYTTIIDYRNLMNDTTRYFFINTFSDDTFREKTITLNLSQGTNTIRIYNDHSWNITYGGSTSDPATDHLPNETPNFDKFVITPMALATAEAQKAAYTVSVMTGEGGTAMADRVSVAEGGSYELTVTPDADSVAKVYINGIAQTSLVQDGESYTLTVSDVAADQNVQVFFVAGRENLEALYAEYALLNGDLYSTNSWGNAQQAGENAKVVLDNENATDADITDAYRALKTALDNMVLRDQRVAYFVDCGDHDPATISGNEDSFGYQNSVTDQHYGADAATGYSWGVVPLNGDDLVLSAEEGCKTDWNANDQGIYTTYQRPLSNFVADLNDGQDKTATFRYADGQDTAGINPRTIHYMFELEPGQYEVTVGMSDTWGNAGTPTVTLSADDAVLATQAYDIAQQDTHTMTIDLSDAAETTDLSVKATSTNATIQMTYIEIVRTDLAVEEPDNVPSASAGIYCSSENGLFRFNLRNAQNVAAVQMTFETSSSEVAIAGLEGFECVTADVQTLANGNVEKTVVLSYLPEDQRGATFACEGEATVATLDVDGANPEITIREVLVAGYNADGNAVFGERAEVDPDYAVFRSFDVNGDGVVDLLDIVDAQKYYMVSAGETDWGDAAACDFNGDDTVNIPDLLMILMNFTTPIA